MIKTAIHFVSDFLHYEKGMRLLEMICLKNAKPMDAISILDRGFHYGDGCFTTARIRNNKIELFERHLKRLNTAIERLSLQANLDYISESIQYLQQEYEQLNGTIKIVLSRGEGQRGYSLPHHSADLWLYYYPQNVTDHHYEVIASGLLERAMGLAMPQLVGIKSLNRLEQVLLKQEADEKGFQEALVTDVQGYIVEGISSNCFIRLNGTWICPELRYNGVHGVMRAEILERMNHYGITFQKRVIDLNELPHIQSVFYCNALHPMKIASCLDDRRLDTQACIDLFNHLQLNQI